MLNMCLGSLAGIMEHVGMFPLDTVKVKSFSSLTFKQTHMQASGRKIGFFKTGSFLYRDEGIIRFWKGAQVIASGCIPAHASYFAMYETLKKHFQIKN